MCMDEPDKVEQFIRDAEALVDSTPVEHRADDLEMVILPDVAKATGGIVSIQRLLSAQCTVDIGCGSGAYAVARQRLGGSNLIIGVDSHSQPSESGPAKKLYGQIIPEDIRDLQVLKKIYDMHPDCVVGIGLPADINKHLMVFHEALGVQKGGFILLITDMAVEASERSGFRVFHGETPIDENICVYENT